MKKRILALCLAFVLMLGAIMPVSAQELTAQQQLMQNIAAGYLQSGDEWTIMDMRAYASVEGLATRRISANAKQAYLDKAVETLSKGGVSEAACSKMILALHALGIDAQELYAPQTPSAINAVELLKQQEHGQSVWVAPYTLAVFNHGEYGTEELERELIAALLSAQNADGSWNEYGAIDDTANAISGLAFYYDTDDDVAQALDAAVEFLSSQQKDSGAFDGGWGENSNSTATVIVALAALGIDVTSDERFIKNENSLMDALMSFALEDLSGFGYMDGQSKDAYSTEQCFRALIAAQQVLDTQSPFNAYDLHTSSLKAGYASGAQKPSQGGGSEPDTPDQQTIEVSFRIEADGKTWVEIDSLELYESASVKDALEEACQQEQDLNWSGSGNYVSSISYQHKTLSERDAGAKSGWKYKVNGTSPIVSMDQYVLKQGDDVVWYYVTDYTQDKTPSGGKWSGVDDASKDEEPTDESSQAAVVFTDVAGHWASAYIQTVYERGLLVGMGKNTFAPDAPMTRAMLVNVLWRMAGKPAAAQRAAFDDVSADSWYSDAAAWAQEKGIVKGVSAGKFAPQQTLTREQLVLMLLRYARVMGYDTETRADLSAFADASMLRTDAKEAFGWAVGTGIVKGTNEQKLAPAQQTTRALIAAVLARMLAKEPLV